MFIFSCADFDINHLTFTNASMKLPYQQHITYDSKDKHLFKLLKYQYTITSKRIHFISFSYNISLYKPIYTCLLYFIYVRRMSPTSYPWVIFWSLLLITNIVFIKGVAEYLF